MGFDVGYLIGTGKCSLGEEEGGKGMIAVSEARYGEEIPMVRNEIFWRGEWDCWCNEYQFIVLFVEHHLLSSD